MCGQCYETKQVVVGGGGVLVFNGAGLVSDVDIGWDAGSTFLTVM